jgi:hypothetical protein
MSNNWEAAFIELIDGPVFEPWDVKTHKRQRRKPRKPSLAAAIRQARKAGLTTGTVTVDGVTLTFGTAESTQANSNEWDEELIRGKH